MPRIDHQFLLLQRLQKNKQSTEPTPGLIGQEMVGFFKTVEKRQNRFGRIGQAWEQIIPANLCEHSCLDSLVRGTLTVLVDSSSHLFELRQVLLMGVEKQLLVTCKSSGLRKITLKAGQWTNDMPQPASPPPVKRKK